MSIRAYNDERWLLSQLDQFHENLAAECCPEITQPVWVYNLYAHDDRFLYVGIASILSRRLTNHRRFKPWWRDVGLLIADLSCCRYHALRAEAHVIRYESPQYNVALPARSRELPDERTSLGMMLLYASAGEI